MLTLLIVVLLVFIGLASYCYAYGHIGRIGLSFVGLVILTIGLLLVFGGVNNIVFGGYLREVIGNVVRF